MGITRKASGSREKRERGGEGVEPNREQEPRGPGLSHPSSRMAWLLEKAGGEAGAETSRPATARLSPANRELQGLVVRGREERERPRGRRGLLSVQMEALFEFFGAEEQAARNLSLPACNTGPVPAPRTLLFYCFLYPTPQPKNKDNRPPAHCCHPPHPGDSGWWLGGSGPAQPGSAQLPTSAADLPAEPVALSVSAT